MNRSSFGSAPPIEAVLFDWNGVLIDDEPLHEQAFRRVLAAAGFELTPEMYRRLCQGRRDRDGFVALAERYGWPIAADDCVAAKCQRYAEIIATQPIPLADGAAELLAWLHGSVPIAIVTSAPRDEVEQLLAQSGQRYAIDLLITGEDVTRGKPDPEGYLAAAHTLGLGPEACAVVEDAPDNLHGLAGYGFQMIGIGDARAAFPAHAQVVASLREIDLNLPLREQAVGQAPLDVLAQLQRARKRRDAALDGFPAWPADGMRRRSAEG